jgi:hypothetical protein
LSIWLWRVVGVVETAFRLYLTLVAAALVVLELEQVWQYPPQAVMAMVITQ